MFQGKINMFTVPYLWPGRAKIVFKMLLFMNFFNKKYCRTSFNLIHFKLLFFSLLAQATQNAQPTLRKYRV